MYRFTFFSQKSLSLLRPLNNLTTGNVISDSRNALILRSSFSLILSSSQRQISSNTSDNDVSRNNDDENIAEHDPHSKIMEILRESTIMNNRNHAIESQVRYGKTFRYGELYAPDELNENNYKNRRNVGRRKPPTVDTFNALKLNPLIEYKNYTLLSNFVSDMGRILPRSITGLTAKNQRKLAKAIKRARSFGLIPSTHRHKVNLYDVEFMTSRIKSLKNKNSSELLDF
ncbi:ribosomal protein S18 [Glomus cerebriforme]|uniref:Small ribosomal subunit protein bS18m n=1 Tax=Glomus cerebriforme TaxID=658196 RepID=A0A397TMP8_9GLOM|nr:ribosomal protein S18 [Glomus cerebriforme]